MFLKYTYDWSTGTQVRHIYLAHVTGIYVIDEKIVFDFCRFVTYLNTKWFLLFKSSQLERQ